MVDRSHEVEQSMGSVEVRRWTREEYEKMIEAGIFTPGNRVELIDGEIFNMTPQKRRHAAAIRAAEEALRSAFRSGHDVQSQLPLSLGPCSEPEPDLSVVRGTWSDYRDAHPSSAVLVVEISDASLEYDRNRKGSLYASAGIADYWIVNLVEERIEIYREPAPSSEALHGWAYRAVQHLSAGEKIIPLAAPDAKINISDLLP
jgi:Uma2 family endonuclease